MILLRQSLSHLPHPQWPADPAVVLVRLPEISAIRVAIERGQMSQIVLAEGLAIGIGGEHNWNVELELHRVRLDILGHKFDEVEAKRSEQ